MNNSILYEIAVGFIPGIGCQNTKQLVSYCGSAENIFKTPKGKLRKIPGIGHVLASAIHESSLLKKAEQELLLAEKKGVNLLFYTHKEYPERLRHFPDSPALIYHKGSESLLSKKTIGIVGTRQATSYGKEITEKIIDELKKYNPTIISGLAYGIDIHAHRAALSAKIPTIGVMATGIDVIYPALHRETAMKMLEQGGLVTEYRMGVKPDPAYFPARNRIVAGLSDALIVVEAAVKGGALITAEIANSYNREVFAVPGNLGSKYNEGCNHLIKSHKATIYTSIKDIEYLLNWDIEKKEPTLNYDHLSEDELVLAKLLLNHEGMPIDELSWKSSFPLNKLLTVLLTMEFEGLIKALPGKKFKLSL